MIKDGNRLRQKEMLLFSHKNLDRRIITFGLKGRSSWQTRKNNWVIFSFPASSTVDSGSKPNSRWAASLANSILPLRITDGHGVAQAIQGELGRMLGAQQVGPVAAPELPQAGGHLIEGLPQLADFVLGVDVDHQIQVAFLDFPN